MSWNGAIGFIGYFLLFLLVLVAMTWWERRTRRTRHPFPENYKLLRMPGEHLWKRIAKSNEDDFHLFFVAMLVPLVVCGAVLLVIQKIPQQWLPFGLVAAIIVLGVSLWLAARWLRLRWNRDANDYLGFFGERYVAEFLEPLKQEGWRIFHDVPCEGATGKFNLDHVVVGPNGVWVIETKTRRKGKARAGFKDYEVAFDGQKLIWPWGENEDGLQQALSNARWLEKWLANMIGESFEVGAVLTFPGWLVTERQLGQVRVVNPKVIPKVVVGRTRSLLRQEQINLIARQLEARCRDVEY